MPDHSTCLNCSAPLTPKKNRRGNPKCYCSERCRRAYDRAESLLLRGTIEDKFWPLVDRRGPDDCWPFLGSISKSKGYGMFHWDGAHRVALAISLGRPLLAGMEACHTCDNPPCCNPAHLFEGTGKDNMADMRAKGRGPDPKSQLGQRKLTDDQVREVRQRRAAGETQQAIADSLGISRPLISMIAARRIWKHLD